MTKLFKIDVGDRNVITDIKTMRLELKQKRRIAKRDNKVFKRGFKEFGVTILNGELWLVGYKDSLLCYRNGLK